MGRLWWTRRRRKSRSSSTRSFSDALAAAAVTAAVLWLVFLLDGFVPFGTNTPAVTDAKLQYLDLFAYCRDVLTGQNSAAYTFSNTLGGTAVAIWAYYLASPFNLLVLFFPKEQMNLFLEVLITAKLSAASAAFALFIGARFRGRIRRDMTLVLSVGYGLMQYTLAQGSNVMWLDGVILLPFLALGIHSAVCARRFALWKLALPAAATVLVNWYTGGINYLFSIAWFLYEMLRRPGAGGAAIRGAGAGGAAAAKSVQAGAGGAAGTAGTGRPSGAGRLSGAGQPANVGRMTGAGQPANVGRMTGAGRYCLGMGTGLLLAVVLFLPNVLALRQGKGGIWDPLSFDLSLGFRGNPLSVFRSYRIGEMSDITRASFFCGTPAAFGTAAFFFSGRIRRREKLAVLVPVLTAWMSCFWKPLFYVFSLFTNITSYWYRFGYLGSFVLLYCAAFWAGSLPEEGGFRSLRSWSVITKAGGTCLLLVLVSQKVWPSGGNASTRTALLMLAAVTVLLGYRYAPESVLRMLRSPEDEASRAQRQMPDRSSTDASRARRRTQGGPGTGAARARGRAVALLLILLGVWEAFLETRSMLNIYHTDTAGEYASYSRQEQAQIGGIREADPNGFYRISQTAARITNVDGLTGAYLDALAYGYASISGYTSCPENIQLEFLERLGYRKEYNSFNIVNTSFLPADSLLGVRYVLSPYGIPGLTKIEELGKHNTKDVYRNPFALPMAMLIEETAEGEAEPGGTASDDPFAYTESLYSRIAGEEAGLWIPLEAEKRREGDTTKWILKLPEAEAGGLCLYGNLPWEAEVSYQDPQWWDSAQEQGKLTVAEGWSFGYGGWLSPSVFYIPVPAEVQAPAAGAADEAASDTDGATGDAADEAVSGTDGAANEAVPGTDGATGGATGGAAGRADTAPGAGAVRVTLETTGEMELRDEQFYALDLTRFALLTERIRARAEEAVTELSVENGKISCTVKAGEEQALLLSVPASKGWNVSVNGQKAEYEAFSDCLMKISLVPGENHITMQYRVPGATAGVFMMLAGLAVLCVHARVWKLFSVYTRGRGSLHLML